MSSLKDHHNAKSEQWEQWDRNYAGVLAFSKTHGHLKLPTADHETRRLGTWLRKQAKRAQVPNDKTSRSNRKLVNWITCQRERAKLGILPDERRVMLKDVGFEFECVTKYEKKASCTVQQQQKWDEMYSQLVEFRRTNGHCRVA